ncbi:MAG: TlpA family protein disulfide reductase [Planctomycetota bacterium]|jgi:thiol-disulfide isomerase/thioredoxin
MKLLSLAVLRVVGSALLVSLTSAAVLAQPTPKRTLETLVHDHEQRMRKAASREQFKAAVARHAQDLEEYLAREAKGAERFDGRFMLVNAYLRLGKRDQAKATLAALDVGAAPALSLLNGAAWAERLQMKKTRGQWIDAALRKPAGFRERMEVATFLMTRLVEVARGEQVFDAAYKKAKDDGGRARVLWHRSLAIREREDLPEGAYERELEALATKFPKTRWGDIARDRLRTFEFRPGVAPIGFELRSLDGKSRALGDYKGKVLLLYFWASDEPVCREMVPVLQAAGKDFHDKGLRLLGIALDGQRQTLARNLEKLKLTWPQVFGGHGFESDIALRYRVERVPYLLLIGKDSKIAAMNLHPVDDFGIEALRAAVKKAVEK